MGPKESNVGVTLGGNRNTSGCFTQWKPELALEVWNTWPGADLIYRWLKREFLI